MNKFHFVDFAAHFQKGFRNHVLSIQEVPQLVKTYGAYGCYATYFFYSDEILTYMATHTTHDARPSLAGYEGKVWAPYFLMDLDHKDLSKALEAARFFTNFFLEKWKVEPGALQIYFSGMKGFHLMLNTHLFGRVTPSKTLPHLFSAMRRHLVQVLPEALRDTVDLGIKDRVRLIRLPNTIHESSGLYKILIQPGELQKKSAAEIKNMARSPRPLPATDETGFVPYFEVASNKAAADFMKRLRRQVRRMTHKPFHYHFRRPSDLSHLEFPCLGMQRIWEHHVEPGYRNNCAIRLASGMRLLGLSQAETQERLTEWNEKNTVGLPEQEVANVVHSAFQHTYPYQYGCHDEVLRHFCSLRSFESCQEHVIESAQKMFSRRKSNSDSI